MGRILLIEDDRGSQILFRNRLAELGYEVVTAPTGARGLMEARAARFDLFLVDIGLGSGIDGYEVCRRLKGVPQIHGIPVVLISGELKSRQELHRGYEAGCEAFLVKGDLTLVEDVIRAMLRIRSLQEELASQNRLLEERNRHLRQERQRGEDLEQALRGNGGAQLAIGPQTAGSSHARYIGRPNGVLIVDAEGVVRAADRGAHDIFDKEVEGRHLASLAPRSGLEAFVRDARTAESGDYRFDLSAGKHSVRSLSASVMPSVPSRLSGGVVDSESMRKVVLLFDAGKRRIAGEMLGPEGRGLPRRELGPLIEAARLAFGPDAFKGPSPRRERVRVALRELAAIDSPVLLLGEPGTGKGLAARCIHFSGERSGSFLPFECAALAPGSLAVELFGRVEEVSGEGGSDRPGLLQLAQDGTLFLRGVDALPLEIQERLATVLETDRVERVGTSEGELAHLRLVASSDRDLGRLAAAGTFSPRLHELLSVFELHLPELRRGSADLAALTEHFLSRFGAGRGTSLSAEAQWVLSEYEWPGNVAELETSLESACVKGGGELGIEDFPAPLRDLHRRLFPDDFIPAPADTPRTKSRPDPLAEAYRSIEDLAEAPSLEAYERKAILHALRETGGDKKQAARLLGIGKSTFYRKLRQHGLVPAREGEEPG